MKAYKLPCGCIIESGTEYILEQCAECHNEFLERHGDDARRHAAKRAEMWAAERGQAVPA